MYQQASCVKQACTAKKLVNECGYPTKQQASSKRRKSTVDILVEECGYPAKAVERALVICGENHFGSSDCFVICFER